MLDLISRETQETSRYVLIVVNHKLSTFVLPFFSYSFFEGGKKEKGQYHCCITGETKMTHHCNTLYLHSIFYLQNINYQSIPFLLDVKSKVDLSRKVHT